MKDRSAAQTARSRPVTPRRPEAATDLHRRLVERQRQGAPRPQADVLALSKARFPDRYKSGQLDRLTTGHVARQVRLADQYRAALKGDVARRLNLHNRPAVGAHVARPIGMHPTSHVSIGIGHRGRYAYHQGRISPHYSAHAFRFPYYGHSFFSSVYWYPHWNPWVNWSWHYRCHSTWDPRPLWSRPVFYEPCHYWSYYRTPVWISLPTGPSGTWVDVAPVVVAQKHDLQLLAVRMVDPGHPEEKLGPRYRVWFRNNSDRAVDQPFDIVLLSSRDGSLEEGLPQAGVRVTTIGVGDTQSVDIRLPIEVDAMGKDKDGNPIPFGTLHVLVDAAQEITETDKTNNGAAIPRAEILPVDPAAFELEPAKAAAGGEVLVAGEGLGPIPGQVLVHLAGLELEAEILGWYDLGVRLDLPRIPLAGPTEAELIIIRGDGAAANPLKITILPPVAEVLPVPAEPIGPVIVPVPDPASQ